MQAPFDSQRYLVKNAAVIALWRVPGVLSGLVVDALVLAVFGLGQATDAFFAAGVIPLLICGVLEVEGPKVLIPALSRSLESGALSSRFLGNLITMSFLLLGALSLLGAVAAPWIIPLQIRGMPDGTKSLAAVLSQILFWLVLLRGLETVLSSALYAANCYMLASSAKLVKNCVTFITVAVLNSRLGIISWALGLLVGSLIATALLSTDLWRRGFDLRPVIDPRDTQLRSSLRLLPALLLGHGFSASKSLLETFLASFLADGSLTALNYANRIVQALAGALLGGLATPTLQMVSRLAVDRQWAHMKSCLRESVRILLLGAVGITAWLVFSSKALLLLLFQRGSFTASDAALVSTLILILTPHMFFSRLLSLLQTPFLASQDTRTPFLSTVVSFASYLVLVGPAMWWRGIYALPAAISLSTVVAAILMGWLFHRRFGPFGWSGMTGFAVRLSAVAILTALAFLIGILLLETVRVPSALWRPTAVLVPSTLGFGMFFATVFALKLVQLGRVLRPKVA